MRTQKKKRSKNSPRTRGGRSLNKSEDCNRGGEREREKERRSQSQRSSLKCENWKLCGHRRVTNENKRGKDKETTKEKRGKNETGRSGRGIHPRLIKPKD